jgi:hypothetical protein
MRVGEGRYRLVVKIETGELYGLCTCSEAHKSEKESSECPVAKAAAAKYRENA